MTSTTATPNIVLNYNKKVSITTNAVRVFLVQWVDAAGRKGTAADTTGMPADVWLLVNSQASTQVPVFLSLGNVMLAFTEVSANVDDGFADPIVNNGTDSNGMHSTIVSCSGKHLVHHKGDSAFYVRTPECGNVAAAAPCSPLTAIMSVALTSSVTVDSRGVLIDHDARDSEGNNYRVGDAPEEEGHVVMHGVSIPWSARVVNDRHTSARTGCDDYTRIDLGVDVVDHINPVFPDPPPAQIPPLPGTAYALVSLHPWVDGTADVAHPVSYEWSIGSGPSRIVMELLSHGTSAPQSGTIPNSELSHVPQVVCKWFDDFMFFGDVPSGEIISPACFDSVVVHLRVVWSDGVVGEDEAHIVLHHKTEFSELYLAEDKVELAKLLCQAELLLLGITDNLVQRAEKGAELAGSEWHPATFLTPYPLDPNGNSLVDSDGYASPVAPSISGSFDPFEPWTNAVYDLIEDSLDLADDIPDVGWYLKLAGKVLHWIRPQQQVFTFGTPGGAAFKAWWHRAHWYLPGYNDYPRSSGANPPPPGDDEPDLKDYHWRGAAS